MPHDNLLALARTVAVAAGENAVRRRAEGVAVAHTKSSPVDVVTAVDSENERMIRGALADARPRDGFYGEESGAEPGSSGLTWLVDPIDGTVNYLYGIPYYAVSIAVVEGDPDPQSWTALVGCVVNLPAGEVFTATLGGGSFLGDSSLTIAPAVPLSQSLVNTGFAYSAEVRAKQAQALAGLVPLVRDIRRQGAASLDLCSVAAGRTNIYLERTLSPWDHAAGALIAREAGAIVKGLGNAAPDHEFILAAHPEMAVEIEHLVVRLGL